MYVNNTCPVSGLSSGADTAHFAENKEPYTAGKECPACSSSNVRTVLMEAVT